MAIITGTTINWTLSPRVVTIPQTDTVISVEDLQDTLQDLEDSEEGIIWPYTRNTSGGESLGGGVTVGLTMELQDTQIAFAPRTTSLSSGTVTTANAAGTVLIDSAATFQADGIVAGATIVNFTDQSATTVISVDSEIQLTHYPLADGTDNDWDSADVYKVWNETQCEVQGGNVVAVDGVGSEISAISPTFGTQVLKTSSSSATTANQTALEHAVFSENVSIDQANTTGKAVSGTDYPTGTTLQPADNIADALTIADGEGFETLQVIGDLTIGASPSMDGYRIVGDNRAQTMVTFSSADTGDMGIESCEFAGSMNGALYAGDCVIGTVTGIGCTTNPSIFDRCEFIGNLTLRADNNQSINLINCGAIENNQLILDVNGTVGDVSIQNFADRIKIINMTSAINVHISSAAGCELEIDASCTAVNLLEVHGAVNIINSSALSIDDDTTQRLVWENTVEGTYTAEEVIRLMSSVLAGKASGGPNATVFRDLSDTKDRVTSTTDRNGNRTAITLDET